MQYSHHQASEEVTKKEQAVSAKVTVPVDNCDGPWKGYPLCESKMAVSGCTVYVTKTCKKKSIIVN